LKAANLNNRSKKIKLSVIVPIYNERDNIDRILAAIKKVDIDKEIILVDDFSTDGTRDYLKNVRDAKVIYHERNRGKGFGIRTGLAHATGDVVIIQDADLEYSPGEFPKLVKPIAEGRTRVVYGSRMLGKGKFLKRSYYANKLLSLLTNVLYRGRITDMETCYKVIDRKLMLSLGLVSARFEIEPEITCKILKRRERVVEIPISYYGRRAGKKIGPKDGIQALWNLLKWKFKH
jgi:dolichol-phosphate mannosyltransferase